MMNWEVDEFFGKELSVYRKKPSSSVASACSGADARQADKASGGITSEFLKAADIESQVDITVGAAVSPRSGDGPAWLPELMIKIDRQARWADGHYQRTKDRYYDGLGDGIDIVKGIVEGLLSQGHSQKDTGEAQDGQVPPVA